MIFRSSSRELNFNDNKTIFVIAFKDIFDLPALAVAITFFSLGNLYFHTHFDAIQTLLASMLVYSLPGQIVLSEQFLLNASAVNILISVFLVNIRFLPMSFVLVPFFEKEKKSLWYLIGMHFVAITGWNNFIENYSKIPIKKRKHYYFYSHLLLFATALMFTFLGFHFINYISREFYIALLITNPIYFLSLFVKSGLVKKDIGLAMLLGAVLVIPFSLISIEWGVILTGIIAGSLSFYIANIRSK